MDQPSSLLIDDFSQNNGMSQLDTRWVRITDTVMGGVSSADHRIGMIDGKQGIHMTGNVSLENNGGFVQVALPLDPEGNPVDLSQFKGVRLQVLGNGDSYFVHLRTSRTWLPWQYYQARFDAGDQWQTVELPFDRFIPENLNAKLNPEKLKRIAIVAAKKEYQADIAVARMEFYR
jgi:hypothetical protein